MSESRSDISIPFPESDRPVLRLTVAPGRLRIAPGAGEPWVSGSYTDPSGTTGYQVSSDGATTRLTHDRSVTGLRRGLPLFDLRLGTARPFALRIESGATDDNHLDLGGVPLTAFDAKQGAGEFTLAFSRPNPVEMEKFHLTAGAAEIEVLGLANTNAAEISIEGGAASFELVFSGQLQRNMHARISTGVASSEVKIPASTPVKITAQATLGSVEVGDGFMTREGAYWNQAAIDGKTPLLTIEATTALGSLEIELGPSEALGTGEPVHL